MIAILEAIEFLVSPILGILPFKILPKYSTDEERYLAEANIIPSFEISTSLLLPAQAYNVSRKYLFTENKNLTSKSFKINLFLEKKNSYASESKIVSASSNSFWFEIPSLFSRIPFFIPAFLFDTLYRECPAMLL